MNRDERNVSRLNLGCNRGEDFHEPSDGTVRTKQMN